MNAKRIAHAYFRRIVENAVEAVVMDHSDWNSNRSIQPDIDRITDRVMGNMAEVMEQHATQVAEEVMAKRAERAMTS